MSPELVAAINAALGLISAGTQIVETLRDKGNLTAEQLQEIIDKQDAAQAEARAALLALLQE